jgi:ribonuclease P protein subunit POP4
VRKDRPGKKGLFMLPKLVMEELIGLDVEIIKSVRKELIGLKGKIVDETLNTFVIETKKGEKKVPKACCVFRFGDTDIDGGDLLFRPEDRIKKYWLKFQRKKHGMQ